MRALAIAAVLLALLAGCAAPAPPPSTATGPTSAEDRTLVTEDLPSSRDPSGLGAVWMMGGGPVGPAVILRTWDDPPEGFREMRLRLDWECLNCVLGQEMRFGAQSRGSLPSEGYREQAFGTGTLEVVVGPDDWSTYGLQVSMTPVGQPAPFFGRPVSPMVLVRYELTGTVERWESAEAAGVSQR